MMDQGHALETRIRDRSSDDNRFATHIWLQSTDSVHFVFNLSTNCHASSLFRALREDATGASSKDVEKATAHGDQSVEQFLAV